MALYIIVLLVGLWLVFEMGRIYERNRRMKLEAKSRERNGSN
jgi:hypothetical protein